jgi:NADH-quinone oxidoreductase subunit H
VVLVFSPNVEFLATPLNVVFPVLFWLAIAAGCLLGLKRRAMPREQQLMLLAIVGAMVLLAVVFAIPAANELIIGLFWFLIKVFAVIYMFIWFRGTFPRFRYDQLMRVGWHYLIPISMGALIVNGIVLLWKY